MTAPRQQRRLPSVIAGVAFTSAAALLIGVGAASLFASDKQEIVIVLFAATAMAGVVGGFVGAPYFAERRR
ncbi:hypothetical protein ACQP2F_02545 [Actinoplanes sp. CA-030573]|uniref:hypothetical protein n=1 Tax=Actinoplanes sp. CA-030573 TaxID=3239898 RepID=UPI003D930C86